MNVEISELAKIQNLLKESSELLSTGKKKDKNRIPSKMRQIMSLAETVALILELESPK